MNLNLPEGTKEATGGVLGLGTLLAPILMDKVPPDDIWKVLAVGGALVLGFIITRAVTKPGR